MSTKLVRYAIFSLIAFAFLLIPVFSTPKVEAASNLAVTPEGYDDIGAVLERLGYLATEIPVADLTDYNKIKDYDAIYINCSDEIDDVAIDAKEPIKQYVDEGGVLYLSDFANSVMVQSFPNQVNFHTASNELAAEMSDVYEDYDPTASFSRVGQVGTQTATVVDPGLASILGKTEVSINFDAPSWVVMDSVIRELKF